MIVFPTSVKFGMSNSGSYGGSEFREKDYWQE